MFGMVIFVESHYYSFLTFRIYQRALLTRHFNITNCLYIGIWMLVHQTLINESFS